MARKRRTTSRHKPAPKRKKNRFTGRFSKKTKPQALTFAEIDIPYVPAGPCLPRVDFRPFENLDKAVKEVRLAASFEFLDRAVAEKQRV